MKYEVYPKNLEALILNHAHKKDSLHKYRGHLEFFFGCKKDTLVGFLGVLGDTLFEIWVS
jgi:hypothetical protein